MAQPWLDDLSEDWEQSDKHMSSSPSLPKSSPNESRLSARSNGSTSSRIPRGSTRSQKSSSGNFLRPRSTKGLARGGTSGVLSERSPSDLNTISTTSGSISKPSSKSSTLPRSTVTSFGDSASSVKHHTVNKNSGNGVSKGDTPEWKRRLQRGDKAETDLFGLTPLEGVFQQPQSKSNANSSLLSANDTEDRPWTLPADSGSSFSMAKQSLRRSTNAPLMEVLQEETEDDSSVNGNSLLTRDEEFRAQSGSGISGDVMPRKASQKFEDPRMRTISGQEEVRNEEISPITISKHNTVSGRPLQGIMRDSIDELKSKLEKAAIDNDDRPSSRGSDSIIYYRRPAQLDPLGEFRQDLGDITSQSLPDDLSMGTDDFASRGGFINMRRGGTSDENSFLRKPINSSMDDSHQDSQQMSNFRSSPPPYVHPHVESVSELPEELPTTPSKLQGQTPSKIDEQTPSSSPARPRSAGSPLKLFGNYDTYTKDRLSRRLSALELGQESDLEDLGARSTPPIREERIEEDDENHEGEMVGEDEENGLRMSQFGKGHLNDFRFTQKKGPDPLPSSNESTPPQQGTIFGNSLQHESGSLPRVRRPTTPTRTIETKEEVTLTVEILEAKRVLNSPGKQRTPKRRRTLLKDEIEVEQKAAKERDIAQQAEIQRLAGRKRKDARYEGQGPPADPEVLATRQILRPRSASRQSSFRDFAKASPLTSPREDNRQVAEAMAQAQADSLTKSVANELAAFGETMNRPVARDETRKGSITTSDYFAEAVKVMEMIRAKRKSMSALGSIRESPEKLAEETEEESQERVDEDDFESTLEQFSRPPSRIGVPVKEKPREPNPRVVSHLRKFEDTQDSFEADDLEKYDHDLPTSDPPGIRIREQTETMRKRKHSDTTASTRPSSKDGTLPNTSSSHSNSTGRSIPTGLSGSSGDRGLITLDKINLPKEVGGMVFDHATKTWVRSRIGHGRKETSDEDPFEDIPDLSVDELEELRRSQESPSKQNNEPAYHADETKDVRPYTREGAMSQPTDASSAPSKLTRFDSTAPVAETRATSWATIDHLRNSKALGPTPEDNNEDLHNEEVEHEIQLYEGRTATSPVNRNGKQPRVVTIAFSSPLVSGIVYQDDSFMSDQKSQDLESPRSQSAPPPQQTAQHGRKASSRLASTSWVTRRNSIDGTGFIGRPVSRIDEQDEADTNKDKSLIPLSDSGAMTPIPRTRTELMLPTTAAKNDSSLISLTPLSEFTFHQIDDPVHLELSYVAHRTHPSSLQQAHGQLSLAVDEMIKAITDVEPYEPYWEQIRRLDLSNKKLATLHRFGDYCSGVEELNVADNEIGQVGDLPPSLRVLNIQRNCLSNLSAWGHLQNLQYLDVSGNEIENLDAFSNLVHLRDLRASENKLRNLDGILDLNGLLSLRLRGNDFAAVDFESAELTRLTHLDLSCNNLTSVQNLHYLPALTYLDLSSNNLSSFAPPRPLAKLTTLRLSSNNLTAIDLSLFPALELLYIDKNKLTEILHLPTARHLDTLSVRSQKPTAKESQSLLATLLSSPTDLRKLYLSANPLPVNLNGQLPSLPHPHLNLQYLDIASCGISSLPEHFGARLPNLRVLNVNFNALKDISSLKGIVRLNKLLAAGNRIARMRKTVSMLERIGGKGSSLLKVDFRGCEVVSGFYSPGDLWRVASSNGTANSMKSTTSSSSDKKKKSLDLINKPQNTDEDSDDQQSERQKTLDPFTLPHQTQSLDSAYTRTLDENTRLKRRIWELLLREKCPELKEVDGLAFGAGNKDVDRGNMVLRLEEGGRVKGGGSESGNGDEIVQNSKEGEKDGDADDNDRVWRRLKEIGVLKPSSAITTAAATTTTTISAV